MVRTPRECCPDCWAVPLDPGRDRCPWCEWVAAQECKRTRAVVVIGLAALVLYVAAVLILCG